MEILQIALKGVPTEDGIDIPRLAGSEFFLYRLFCICFVLREL